MSDIEEKISTYFLLDTKPIECECGCGKIDRPVIDKHDGTIWNRDCLRIELHKVFNEPE